MRKLQKCALIGIANILLVAQYPPEHRNQLLPVPGHCREYPPLAQIDRPRDGEVQKQLAANGFAKHLRPIRQKIKSFYI
jgi:hypothetical protein